MTTWLEGKNSIFMGAQAYLMEDDRETASSWASKHVIHNPAYKWVLGRFVEADRANNNKQLFSLKGLQMNRPTIAHAPMNMNHSSRRVVGAFVATDLVYPIGAATAAVECQECSAAVDVPQDYDPTDDPPKDFDPNNPPPTCPKCGSLLDKARMVDSLQAARSDAGLNAYIEALGVFWRHYFPEEFALVEAAHAEGKLYYSMECIPAKIQCAGVDGCGETYEYAGRISDTYCSHLNDHISDKHLIDPHFTAGAILVPPVRPGWSNADIHSLVAGHAELAEQIYDGVQEDLSHLSPRDWELLMAQLLALSTA